MLSNIGLTKAYKAGAQISPYTIVKWDAVDFQVLPAAAATDKSIGVTPNAGTVPAGQRVDVIVAGMVEVIAGGTITRGDPITSNATGQGVTAAPAGGANNRIIGFAECSAVAGDIFPVFLYPSVMQG